MLTNILPLSHQEQQAATEQIHQLIATGMSSNQAIARVAQEIREHRRKAACHPSLKKDPLQN